MISVYLLLDFSYNAFSEFYRSNNLKIIVNIY